MTLMTLMTPMTTFFSWRVNPFSFETSAISLAHPENQLTKPLNHPHHKDQRDSPPHRQISNHHIKDPWYVHFPSVYSERVTSLTCHSFPASFPK